MDSLFFFLKAAALPANIVSIGFPSGPSNTSYNNKVSGQGVLQKCILMKSGVLTGFTIIYGGPIKALGEGCFSDSAANSVPLLPPSAMSPWAHPDVDREVLTAGGALQLCALKGLKLSLAAWIPRGNLSREKTGPFLSGIGGTPALVPALRAEALDPPQWALSVVSWTQWTKDTFPWETHGWRRNGSVSTHHFSMFWKGK